MVEKKMFQEEFYDVLENADLSEREKDILIKRNSLYNTRKYILEELGQIHGITRERIRQVEKRANEKFAKALRDKKLVPASYTRMQKVKKLSKHL